MRAVCIREVQKDLSQSSKALLESKLSTLRLTAADGFKAYKDVFRLGALATAPGGMLWCFSCSQHLERSRFQEAVWTALLEAQREAQVLAHLGQPADHPYGLNHPEGFYLKGLWLRLR